MKKTIIFLATYLSLLTAGTVEGYRGNSFSSASTQDGETSPDIIQLDEDNLEEVLSSEHFLIIDAYSENCPRCQYFGSIFHQVNEEYGDLYQFAQLDVYQDIPFIDELNISTLPTIIFMIDGVEVGRHSGFLDKKKFIAKMKWTFGS